MTRQPHSVRSSLIVGVAVFGLAATSGESAFADLNEGLIAHWPLNEGQGSSTEDVAGDHDGTIYGGPPWVTGVSGYALDFDGSDDYVNVGPFSQFGDTQEFSLCAWINRTTVSGSEPYILNNMYSSGRGIGMFSYGDSAAVIVGGADGGPGQVLAWDHENIADGEWHLIVGTYDGSALELYIDGEWRASDNSFSFYTASTENMNIGRMEHGNGHHFDGSIDEVRIYDRALSEGEVRRLYLVPAASAPFPHDAPKNRYLSIDTTTNETNEVAYKVTGHTTPKWVGAPVESNCVPQGDCVGQRFANLADAPVFRVWTEDVLHISGCEIVPVRTYDIRACAPPDGAICSEPLVIGTIRKPVLWWYGDVVGLVDPTTREFTPPNGYLNVTDVSGYQFAFQGHPRAPHTTWVDLHGGAGYDCDDPPTDCVVPQQILNVSDLSRIIWGFQGETYEQTPGQVVPGDCP